MLVGLLTIQQKNQLVGTELQHDWFFNPVQDMDKNWIISTTEMYNNTNPDVVWVKNLPLIDWIPPVEDNTEL